MNTSQTPCPVSSHPPLDPPQGCVLSPHTNECQSNHESGFVLKYADDSVIASLLYGNEHNRGPVVNELFDWCEQSFLQINVAKNTLIKCDLGLASHSSETIQYSIVLDSKHNFDANTDGI